MRPGRNLYPQGGWRSGDHEEQLHSGRILQGGGHRLGGLRGGPEKAYAKEAGSEPPGGKKRLSASG